MTGYTTAVWQDYGIDPLTLIGKAVHLTVVTDETPRGSTRKRGSGHFHFGVVAYIHEHRGEVALEQPAGDWAREALDVTFEGTYPFVDVHFTGGATVRFNPEKDAASFAWVEDGAA